jgi:hypothetical protein
VNDVSGSLVDNCSEPDSFSSLKRVKVAKVKIMYRTDAQSNPTIQNSNIFIDEEISIEKELEMNSNFIKSYFGESIIISILSCCCLVLMINIVLITFVFGRCILCFKGRFVGSQQTIFGGKKIREISTIDDLDIIWNNTWIFYLYVYHIHKVTWTILKFNKETIQRA